MGKSERSDGNNCKCYFYLEIVIEFEFQVIKKINDTLRKDASDSTFSKRMSSCNVFRAGR